MRTWKTSRQFLEKNPMGYTMQGFGLKEHFKQTAVVPILKKRSSNSVDTCGKLPIYR
jgi:hypothetical protein